MTSNNNLFNKETLLALAQGQKQKIVALIDERFDPESDETLARIAEIESAKDFAEDISLSEFLEKFEIDPLMRYCYKTGQPIDRRDPETVKMAIRVNGLDNTAELFDFLFSRDIHPAWLRTDGQTLDKLIKLDPLGYFVYAADIAIRRNNPAYKNGFKRIEDQIKWFKQKIRLYAYLRTVPLRNVIQCNTGWLFLLQVDPYAAKLPWKDLTDIIRATAFHKFVEVEIKRAMGRILNKNAGVKPVYKFSDIHDAVQKVKGPGQFRAQNEKNIDTSTQSIVRLLRAAGLKITEMSDNRTTYTGIDPQKPPKKPWFTPDGIVVDGKVRPKNVNLKASGIAQSPKSFAAQFVAKSTKTSKQNGE